MNCDAALKIWRKRMTEEDKVEIVSKILKGYGIEMAVDGCGCCGSPSVTFIWNGIIILNSEDDFNFDTRELKEEKKEG